jgi:glycosyltransferase involved in cell wall biosynthesis
MIAFAKPPPSGAITDRPVRVLLVLGALDGGGAERVAVNILNRCEAGRVDVRLGLLRRTGPYLAEVDGARIVEAHRITAMVRETRPDVLMSFGMGVNLLTALAMTRLGRQRPLWICREDSNLAEEIANLTRSGLGRALVGALVGHAYRSADVLLSVSSDLAARLERRLRIPPDRVSVIHNPTDIARITLAGRQSLTHAPQRPFIVTAGRLTRQKGHDMLIEAFAASRAARDFDLVILGEGPLELELRARAATLGVAERVRFPGFQANPWAWFARARLFVLSSRWEGFGNVVAESMACGAPVLAADCDFGPREQITHGESGWLVPVNDVGALAAGLDALLGDPVLMARLAAAGAARAGRFDIGVVMEAYTALFLDLVAKAPPPNHPFPEHGADLV